MKEILPPFDPRNYVKVNTRECLTRLRRLTFRIGLKDKSWSQGDFSN